MPESEIDWYAKGILEDPVRRYYTGMLKNVYIGKIDVYLEKHEAGIYGFAVLPEYRGQGYGRQILARTIQEIIAMGQKHIMLEVATENRNALSLYQSCGFKETGSYDYYGMVSHRED
jgi:ribosomal protein S18 acetylase RimI-like enzyme